MNQDTNREALPRLRFPEFQDAGEWEVDELGMVSFFVNDRIPLEQLTLTNYVSTENILPNYEGVITASKLPSSGSVIRFNANDILISNIRPYLKKVWFSDHGGGASNDVVVVRAKEKLNDDYLSFVLRNDTFIEYIMKGAKGVKMPRGDISLMKQYPLAYPTPPEQQKIADCLASLDELIAAQRHKLDSLKVHKQGLMQQLFPAEGETSPRLRFPEFGDAGEWEEEQLFNVLDYERPDKYIVVDTNYLQSGVPVLTANKSFILGYTHEEQGVFNDTPVIIFDDFTVDKKYVDFPFKVKSSAIKILRIKGNNSLKFIYEVMNQIKFEAKEHKRYYISAYQNLFVKIPNPPEQQKIADCLASLDELIAAHRQKLDALKVYKKGLMQQLFPSVEEVQE